MEDQVRGKIFHQRDQLLGVGDAELMQSGELVHPPGPACRQVISDRNLITSANQGIGEVRPDKSGTAGNEYAHGVAVYARPPPRRPLPPRQPWPIVSRTAAGRC